MTTSLFHLLNQPARLVPTSLADAIAQGEGGIETIELAAIRANLSPPDLNGSIYLYCPPRHSAMTPSTLWVTP